MINTDYEAIRQEFQLAVEESLFWDVGTRTQLELSGAERQAFLHNFCTHDIKSLRIHAGCEAFLCNIKGRLLGHVLAFSGEEAIWIESVPQQASALVNHLQRYAALADVKLHDRTTNFTEFLIAGPQSDATLGRLNLPSLGNWNHRIIPNAVSGQSLWIKRADLFEIPGYWLSMPREVGPHFHEQLVRIGLSQGSTQAFEALRIEAAFPCYGVDLSDENLAQEANRTGQAISFTKGCYLGQEPIARLHAMGHVNKELKRFEIVATSPECLTPECPTVLTHPDDASKEIGRLTSIAWSPRRQTFVALGMIRSAFSETGRNLIIQGRDDATVRVL